MSIITNDNKKCVRKLVFVKEALQKNVIILVHIASKRGPFLPDPLYIHFNFLLLPWEYIQYKCKTFESNTTGEAKKKKSRHNRKIGESVQQINNSQMCVHTHNSPTF